MENNVDGTTRPVKVLVALTLVDGKPVLELVSATANVKILCYHADASNLVSWHSVNKSDQTTYYEAAHDLMAEGVQDRKISVMDINRMVGLDK